MHFNMLGLGERRFYSKVVNKSERLIQDALDTAGVTIDQAYAAEYDSSAQCPVLAHRLNNKIDIQIIRFATGSWEPGLATPDAANQIASVLTMQFPKRDLSPVFTEAGFIVGKAGRKKERLPDDDLDDATVVINSELSSQDFFFLADEIDIIVFESGLGDISGTGGGFTCWWLDLTSRTLEDCILLVAKELRARNIEFTVSQSAV